MTLLLTSVNQTLAPSADQARQQFAIVPAYLALEATPAALKVYVALGLRADHETGICWPSHARIVTDTGLCRRTVIRSLGELVKLGAIERNHRKKDNGGDTSNLYRLTFAINRRANGGGAKNNTGGVQKTAHKPEPSELDKTPTPSPREAGTNPRVVGTNPRAKGTNPRAVGTNPRRALSFAVAEARKDPDVRDADKVGRHRYDQDPAKYQAMANREEGHRRLVECDLCDADGWRWLFNGEWVTRDTIDSTAKRCDHPQREFVDVD